MEVQEIEKLILHYAVEGMPSYRNIVEERRIITDFLYRYMSAIIPNDTIEKTVKEVMTDYVSYDGSFERILIDIVYSIHINIINRLFNKYLFEKYHIEEDFGVKADDTFLPLISVSLVNFEFEQLSGYKNYRDDDFYQLKVKSNLKRLIPDDLNLDNITTESVLNLSETNIIEFRQRYTNFYIKYNKLVKNIELELEILNKQCGLNLKL